MKLSAIVPLPPTRYSATAFSPAGDHAPLIRVVRTMRTLVPDARVVIATVAVLASNARSCLDDSDLDDVTIAVARDGAARRQLLQAGLKELGAEANPSDHVLVWDLGHPLAPVQVANRVVGALRRGCDVVVPTLPVTDTVKTVDDQGKVLSTVDRSTLRTVQYPRGYTASALLGLLASPSAADDGDELGTALRVGHDVGTVDGDANGFWVDLPRDAPLVEAIIACHPG